MMDTPNRSRDAASFLLVRPRWLSLLSVLAAFGAWWGITAFALVPAVLLPSPAEVAAAAVDILRNGYRETTLAENIG